MEFLPSFFLGLRQNKVLLLLWSIFGTLTGIVFYNNHILPLDLPTLFFFSFVVFLLALYRLGWVFLLFVSVVPLEIVNLAPTLLGGVTLRPYQWLAGILLLAVGIRFAFDRLPFKLLQPRWFDALPLLIVFGAFLALFEAPVFAVALKQALVVTSFALVYFLGRIFFRTVFDIMQALPFFLATSVVVCGYAIWQNISFLAGQESFAVMAGRPNATFAEADWLGLFIVLVLGAACTLLARSCTVTVFFEKTKKTTDILKILFSSIFLILSFVVLIITVARSAWLGAFALIVIFTLGLLFERGVTLMRTSFPQVLLFSSSVLVSFLVAIGLVYIFHLSPFQFLNRIQSTGSGLQKITVACEEDRTLPERINTLEELVPLRCRHIDLEAIAVEKDAGKFVKETFRNDPNISIRQEIYGKVFVLLKEHPLLGIGWGSASFFLGTDERGAGLNASNVFLEVWLGSGIIGLVAFVLWLGLIGYTAFQWYFEITARRERLFPLFLFSTLIGMTVFNLFNSGILLGFFFLFLVLGSLSIERWEDRRHIKKEIV